MFAWNFREPVSNPFLPHAGPEMSEFDVEEVRRDIRTMQERIKSEDYYAILGVQNDAGKPAIQQSFRNLAKQWHVDRFPKEGLGALRNEIKEIFAFLNTAHATLTDGDKRVEYDLDLGDGTDIHLLLEAENVFRRGKGLLKGGHYSAAAECFVKAANLHEGESEYEAHKLYGEYLLLDKTEDGVVEDRKRGNEIFRELDGLADTMGEKDWHMVFLGAVALGINKKAEAHSLFREALLIDSTNVDARRYLRLIAMRRDKEDGLLSKIKAFFSPKK
jgi:curved DNA-binding protein CbpA